MFQLTTPTDVTLKNVNLRGEKHGEDTVPAIDVELVLETGNDILDTFDPMLKTALYYRSDATEAQTEVPGVPAIVPNRRFPKLEPIAWDLEHTGAKVIAHYGIEGSEVELFDCKVNNFRIECREGGTVDVTFRVQTSSVPDGAIDKLRRKLRQIIDVSILLPEAQEPAQEPATPKAKGKGRGKGKDATQAFLEAQEQS